MCTVHPNPTASYGLDEKSRCPSFNNNAVLELQKGLNYYDNLAPSAIPALHCYDNDDAAADAGMISLVS